MSTTAAATSPTTREPLSIDELTPIPEENLIFPRPPVFDDPAASAAPQAAAGRRASGSSPTSASTRASPGTSPPATRNCPTTSGSTRSAASGRSGWRLPGQPPGRGRRGRPAGQPAAFAIHSQCTPPGPTSWPPPTPLDVRQGAGRRSAGRSTPSPRTPAPSTGTTPSSTTTPASSSTLEEGKRIAHALGEHKAAILRNHGLLTVGHTVDEAAWWFITMERSVPGAAAGRGGRHAGAHRRRGRPLHPRRTSGPRSSAGSIPAAVDEIVRTDPDLFDSTSTQRTRQFPAER